MADETGKTSPASDPKTTDRPAPKSGPVKPPVLEGTARPSPTGKPGDSARADTSAKPLDNKPLGDKPTTNTATPRPPAPSDDSNSGSVWLAGLVGGVIGLGAAYGLAWFGLWPVPPQAPAPTDPRLAQFATAIPELETVTGTVQDELSTLTGRVATLEANEDAETPASTADPALAEQVAALSARLDELAAATSQASDSTALATIEADLAALREETSGTATQLAEAKQALATLSETATDSADADAATLRLPLIFSSLESAFEIGRPYETELAALRQALPETMVPEAVAGRAAAGLPSPDVVESQLQAVLPDMLAGRPVAANASWQDTTLDWFRGLVAMRPTGAIEGDSPDAVVSRLEAAIARQDFVAAAVELASLPETMRRAAEPFAADIASLAAAQNFLSQLRSRVLSGESGT